MKKLQIRFLIFNSVATVLLAVGVTHARSVPKAAGFMALYLLYLVGAGISFLRTAKKIKQQQGQQ